MSSRRRPGQTLEKRLWAYSALAGAATLASPAQAACSPPAVLTGSICHTDVDPDLTITGFGGQFVFDFDHDGDAELQLFITSSLYLRRLPISVDGPDVVNFVVGSGLTPLASGHVISLGNATSPAPGPVIASPWWQTGEHFAGLRLQLTDGTGSTAHLGWVRMQHGAAATWTLYDYAWNATPDAPIEAGQTTPVELQSFEIE